MSALLIKETPKGLHQWLKSEAQYNRRSLNQQVLICLEWCMKTYGAAQRRNPFAALAVEAPSAPSPTYARGRELSSRLAALVPLDKESAEQMKKDVRRMRSSKTREFNYGCFA